MQTIPLPANGRPAPTSEQIVAAMTRCHLAYRSVEGPLSLRVFCGTRRASARPWMRSTRCRGLAG